MKPDKQFRLKKASFTWKGKQYEKKDLMVTFTDMELDMSVSDFLGSNMTDEMRGFLPTQVYFGSPKECDILEYKVIEKLYKIKGITQEYDFVRIESFM